VTPLYLYAIVEARPRRALGKGVARRPLTLVRVERAYVVVERAEAPDATPEALVAHDRIIQRIARATPAVLPLRFASTAPDRAAIEALVAPLSGALADAFERVRGAVQFTLRVSGRRAAAPKAGRRVGPGTRWLAKRIAKQRVVEIAPLTEATRPFVREARAERHDRPPLLASVYHLVAREDVRAWRAAVARSLPLLDGVRVTTTGPWPPYAFAELA
jgi:hypothetical protein